MTRAERQTELNRMMTAGKATEVLDIFRKVALRREQGNSMPLRNVKISDEKTEAEVLLYLNDINLGGITSRGALPNDRHFLVAFHDAPNGVERATPSGIGWVIESGQKTVMHVIAVAEKLVGNSLVIGIVEKSKERWPDIDLSDVQMWEPK